MFDEAQFWHWWALGLALGVVEIIAPGTYFLWLGIAAGLVGLILFVFPAISFLGQLFLFGALALTAIAVSRLILRRFPITSEDPDLNRRAEQYIGRELTLDTPIRNHRGRVKIGDTMWAATGDDLPAGTVVRVIGVDGVALRVEPAKAGSSAPT